MKFPLVKFNSNAIVTTDIEVNANNLMLRYSITATEDLIWPEFTALERKDELWKSTCLELFLSSPDDPSYLEINLSPCGAWNSYSFSGYRNGMTTQPNVKLIEFDNEGPGVISACFQINQLPDPVLLGPSAILSAKDGSLGYFSTTHGDGPDFHNRQHHVLVGLDHL
jgi:hypothetical protein